MTTLKHRPNTALLVVDMQNGVVAGAHERDAVVTNIGCLFNLIYDLSSATLGRGGRRVALISAVHGIRV